MMITDGEAALLMASNSDRAYYSQQIGIANTELRRQRAVIASLEQQLIDERARRQVAEAWLRRH